VYAVASPSALNCVGPVMIVLSFIKNHPSPDDG
jgi:hypothetical protein